MRNELVQIYTAPDKYTAEMQRDILKEHGISSVIRAEPQAAGVFTEYALSGQPPFSPWIIYVQQERVKRAMEILEAFGGEEVRKDIPLVSKKKGKKFKIVRAYIWIFVIIIPVIFYISYIVFTTLQRLG